MDIRLDMKKLARGLATGGSIAALLTLGIPGVASAADLDSEPLTAGYACPDPEAGCGGKDKKEDKKGEAKKDDTKKDDAKKDAKKGKKEGKCGEGKCGEGKCG